MGTGPTAIDDGLKIACGYGLFHIDLLLELARLRLLQVASSDALAAIRAAHDPSRPLNGLSEADLDATLVSIAKHIRDAANT